MPLKKTGLDKDRLNRVIAEARNKQDYREQALKIYPWICARCGRESTGKRLRELTVHHKDHNHNNNPPDGSNWELLCIYCHDNEHTRYLDQRCYDEAISGGGKQDPPSSTYRPFAGLEALLKDK